MCDRKRALFLITFLILSITRSFCIVSLDKINYLDKIFSEKDELMFSPNESKFKINKFIKKEIKGYQISWMIPGELIDKYVDEINKIKNTLRRRKFSFKLGFDHLDHLVHRKTKLYFYEKEHLYRVEYDNEKPLGFVDIKKNFKDWLKKDFYFEVMHGGTHELNSDSNQNITLNSRSYESSLMKKLFTLYSVQIYAGFGLNYTEFAYDNRSYIFKNGPEIVWRFKLKYERVINSRISLLSAIDLKRSDLKGDKFENRVDPRQGEPKVSGMNLTQSKVGIQLNYELEYLKKLKGVFIIELSQIFQKIDMEIGWRSNEREIMKTKNPFENTIYLNLSPDLWNVKNIFNIKMGYGLNDGFKCGIFKKIKIQ
jgi:hypothetical protein